MFLLLIQFNHGRRSPPGANILTDLTNEDTILSPSSTPAMQSSPIIPPTANSTQILPELAARRSSPPDTQETWSTRNSNQCFKAGGYDVVFLQETKFSSGSCETRQYKWIFGSQSVEHRNA